MRPSAASQPSLTPPVDGAAGGAQFGYLLLWVILTANLMGMVIQSMSAKLGIATGMNLPEV